MSATADETAAARILLEQWDPLGAADIDAVADAEYLYEAARVVSLLRTGIDREGLIAHLASERRGLSRHPDAVRDHRAAEALVDWWATVENA